MDLQGKKANNSGTSLEELTEDIMKYYKFEPIHFKDFVNYREQNIEDLFSVGGRYTIRHYPYKTLLGKDGEMDRVIYNNGYTIGVECRRQNSSGSVDEKLPHTYENVLGFHPTNESIILVDGTGFSEGALPWLKQAIDTGLLRDKYKTDKKMHLMWPEDLIVWARNKF
jgi:predicted lipase